MGTKGRAYALMRLADPGRGVAQGLPRPPGTAGGRAGSARGGGGPDCGTFLFRDPHAAWPNLRLV